MTSEYKLHAKEDGWRLWTAINALSNPAHPKSRFNVGTLETLENEDGEDLWNDLYVFYKKYYVASNMSVVLYGKEDLATLEQYARNSFTDVPAGEKPQIMSNVVPYLPEQLGIKINLIPLKDERDLSLTFPMPSKHSVRDKKPLTYLGRLIGYEGAGSLHSELKSPRLDRIPVCRCRRSGQ